MTPAEARQRIAALAGDSANVVLSLHAKSRMRKRNITLLEVLNTLRKGAIAEGPAFDLQGCWRCTMRRFAAGEDVSVTVAIRDSTLVIVTAY